MALNFLEAYYMYARSGEDRSTSVDIDITACYTMSIYMIRAVDETFVDLSKRIQVVKTF